MKISRENAVNGVNWVSVWSSYLEMAKGRRGRSGGGGRCSDGGGGGGGSGGGSGEMDR